MATALVLPNLLAAAITIPITILLCWWLTGLFGPSTLAERQWAQNERYYEHKRAVENNMGSSVPTAGGIARTTTTSTAIPQTRIPARAGGLGLGAYGNSPAATTVGGGIDINNSIAYGPQYAHHDLQLYSGEDFGPEQYFASGVYFHFVLGIITLLATTFVVAPYGSRLTHSKDELSLLGKLCRYSVASTPAWLLQELPTLVAFVLGVLPALLSWYALPRAIVKFAAVPVLGFVAPVVGSVISFITSKAFIPMAFFQQFAGVTFYPTILLFLIHYVHRTLIFPWLFVNGKGHALGWREVDEGGKEVDRRRRRDVLNGLRRRSLPRSSSSNNARRRSNDSSSDSDDGVVAVHTVADEYRRPLRHNPLLTVLLATVYCAFNGCLQVSANIATTDGLLIDPATANVAVNTKRSLIRSAFSATAAAARKAAGVVITIATPWDWFRSVTSTVPTTSQQILDNFSFVFGEFFGFAHIYSLPWFYFGCFLFFWGMWINVTSDYYLFSFAHSRERERRRRLREAANGGRALTAADAAASSAYVLPDTYWHLILSAPNYFGEILEWVGYTVALWGASGSGAALAAGLSFVFYTFANLAPRAGASRAWYKRTFGKRYTTEWTLIPYVW